MQQGEARTLRRQLTRFFIRIDPEQPFRIERLAIELCDRYGKDLFTSLESESGDEESREYARAESAKLRQTIERFDIDLYSLYQSGIDFRPSEDRFWDTQAMPLKVTKSDLAHALDCLG